MDPQRVVDRGAGRRDDLGCRPHAQARQHRVVQAQRAVGWREYRIEDDERIWDTLPDTMPHALATLERTETLDFLWRAMRDLLTTRQRQVFQAAVLDEVPIDVLADRLGSTRGAIYKVLRDARRTLRLAMARAGEELP